MSKQSSSVCPCEAANERCANVLHPPNAYSRHTVVIQRRRKTKNNLKSAILFGGSASVSTGRGCQLERKWHALTFIIHNLTSSLCFSSPHSFSAPLCYLLSGRQHTGHAVPMRLQQNTTTCLTWDNKSQSHMGTLAAASRPFSSHADAQPPIAWFIRAQMMWTIFREYRVRKENRPDVLRPFSLAVNRLVTKSLQRRNNIAGTTCICN